MADMIAALQEVTAKYVEGLRPIRDLALALAPALADSRAPEYERLLIEKGFDPASARFCANWAITKGAELAAEITDCRRRVGSAMRKITQAQGRVSVARRAAELLPDLDGLGRVWLEDGLSAAGQPLSYEAFRDIVERSVCRDPSAFGRLREIVQGIFLYIPKARGKSLSAETVTHAIILVFLHDFGGSSAYTYADSANAFIDGMSAAASRQFGRHFNPTGASELVRKLLLAEEQGRKHARGARRRTS